MTTKKNPPAELLVDDPCYTPKEAALYRKCSTLTRASRDCSKTKREVSVNVVPSTEEIDFETWLDAYVDAILEAKGYPVEPSTDTPEVA